jgi:hypothetical protein
LIYTIILNKLHKDIPNVSIFYITCSGDIRLECFQISPLQAIALLNFSPVLCCQYLLIIQNPKTMKNTVLVLILVLSGIFSASFANAQCPANKVYACRYDACGFQECKCVSLVSLQKWLATVPPCNWKPPKWWVRLCQPGAGMENSLKGYPYPVSTDQSGPVAFSSLKESQNPSAKIPDMDGRQVSILVDKVFEAERLTWRP